MNVNTIEHNKVLDVAKGIAIILVVLGHSFPSNVFNDDTCIDVAAKIIYDFVYSFHMPTFFAISGYLFFNAWNLHRVGTIKKKAMRLLIPYFTFSIIYIPLRLFASSMANSDFGNQYWKIILGVSPNGGVWFLYTLFVFFTITFYCVNSQNINVILLFALILSIVFQLGFPFSHILHDVAPRVLDIFRFYFYFILGLIVNKNKSFMSSFNTKTFVLEFVVFVILFVLLELFSASFFTVPIALLGIHLTVLLSSKLQSSVTLAWLGINSMDIYLLHGPLMVVLRVVLLKLGVGKLFIAIGLFMGSLLIAFFISRYIIHKVKVIEFLCTGIWRKA